MAETVHARILRYLGEAHAAEHHLEKVYRGFDGEPYAAFAQRAATHQLQLEAMLQERGAAVGGFREGLAAAAALAPLHSRLGDSGGEKSSQRLVFAVAASSFGMGTYASLAAAAEVVRETELVELARKFLGEERADFDALQGRLGTFPGEAAPKLVVAFLEDAVAAEHSFESQSKAAAKHASAQPEAKAACALFTEHAKATREDFDQLTRRLESLGAEPSVLKGFFAEMVNFAPKLAAVGHDANERLTQDLVALFAAANAQTAIFRQLGAVAQAAGDSTTATLASALEQKNQPMAERVWAEIEPAAETSIATMPYAISS